MESSDAVPNMFGNTVCSTSATSNPQEKKALCSDTIGKHQVVVQVEGNWATFLPHSYSNVNSNWKKRKDIAHIVDKKCPAGVCKKLLRYEIDLDKCIGCGICAKNCPASAITRTDYIAPGHKLASMSIDAQKCVKCGACVDTCKFKAISKV